MNLLMIAPLYDNKGQVRYFLGCQIDVSQLIENGRGLESFSQLLAQDRSQSRFGGRVEKDPKHVLGEFGALLSEEESSVMKGTRGSFSGPAPQASTPKPVLRGGRRILGMDDEPGKELWPDRNLGPSGRLPGVYQNVSHHLSMLLDSTNTLFSTSSCDPILPYASPSPLPPSAYPAYYKPNSSTELVAQPTSARAFSTPSPTAQVSRRRSPGSRTPPSLVRGSPRAWKARRAGSTARRCSVATSASASG